MYSSHCQKVFAIFLCALLSGLYPLPVSASEPSLQEVRELFYKGDAQKAHELIYKIPLENKDPKRMGLLNLFRGVLSYEVGAWEKAVKELDRAIQMGTRLRDVGHFYKGLALVKLEKLVPAEAEFSAVKNWQASDFLRNRAEMHMAKIFMEQKKFPKAKSLFTKLQRKLRGTEYYPEILFSLLKIAKHDKKSSEVCRWAIKLYRDYPTYEKVKDWGLRWSGNTVDNRTLSCRNSLADRKARLRRLQWSGASSKAFEELQVFEKSSESQFDKDFMMSEYLINEGHVQEALSKLLPYYPTKKKDFKFTMLLAKAAARGGEFQMAIGVYTKASKTFRGGEQRTALFRAAFLSYQHQDYDGAIRRFERLKKRHPTSSLTLQANWYIPWLKYLKGDFEEAHKQFTWAAAKRLHRLPRKIDKKQMEYWIGMSLLKMGRKPEAEKIFSKISQDDFMGYYSVASFQRLKDLAGDRPLSFVEGSGPLRVHENWFPQMDGILPERDIATADIPGVPDGPEVPKDYKGYFSDWEDLPFMQDYLELDNPTEIYALVTEPVLRSHIERAKDLSAIGMSDLSKWELYSVEKRTRSKDYLKTLMFEYHRNGIYHRSAYLGTRHFGAMRSHLGLHLGASLWQFVYPRAFEKDVVKNATKFGVPPEFVWAIMKAETAFRPDAVSPVGAKGLMQVMPHTGRKIASLMGDQLERSDDLTKPHISVKFGSRYLSRVLKKFKNKIPLAAAAYNGGPHRVHAWLSQFGHLEMDEFIEHIPFLETRNYVKRVVRYYSVYNLLYNKDTEASGWLSELVDVHMEGSPPTRETWEVL